MEILACAKSVILMIPRMNFAFSAIILGLNFLNLTQFSSHKIGDYNSCNLENTKENCTKCDNTKGRTLLSASPSECVCPFGWFDPDAE